MNTTQVNTYLTFNGKCREAMQFYKDCLGGELMLQTVAESPLADKMPKQMKDAILHSTLTNGALIIMGSDMVDNNRLIKGNAVSLMLNCSNEEDIKKYYVNLSEDGEATHPLENTFWGALFGSLTDKYGNQWLLNFNKSHEEKNNY